MLNKNKRITINYKVYGKKLGDPCSTNDQIPCGQNLACSTSGFCSCISNYIPLQNKTCGMYILDEKNIKIINFY